MSIQPFLNPTALAKHIESLWRDRCRFTVLAGAGLSIASGIPSTSQLPQHLCFCLDRWLNGTWDPQKGNWPSLGEGSVESAATIRTRWKTKALEAKDGSLIFKALGDCENWNQALDLLSRARVRTMNGVNNSDPYLGAPDFNVLDSYFQFLVRGKEPSLAHRMLAALADQLRIQLVLTTNFDDLIEQAFAKSGVRLDCFEVHRNAGLPSPRLLLGQPSVVKLHGSRYGLRADWSLNDYPTESDKRAFVSYLAGEDLMEDDKWEATPKDSNTDRVGLLVAGYSASDKRIRGMLKEALIRLPQLEVFWFCHTPADCIAVVGIDPRGLATETHRPIKARRKESFAGEVERQLTVAQSGRGKSIKQRLYPIHGDFGLLSLQIYQVLTGTIPPAGMFFPTSWTLPYPTLIPASQSKEYAEEKLLLSNAIAEMLAGSKNKPFLRVWSQEGAFGSLTVCGDLARDNGWSYPASPVETAWMDLDDVLEPDDVFFHMVGIISRKCGISDPRPHFPRNDTSPKRLTKWLIEQLGSLPLGFHRKWVFFLNGRDAPGQNHFVGLSKEDRAYQAEAWSRPGDFVSKWIDVLTRLNCEGTLHLHIVLITSDHLPLWKKLHIFPIAGNDVAHQVRHVVTFVSKDVVRNIVSWCTKAPKAEVLVRQFLIYTIIQFDFMRYPAAIERVMQQCYERGLFALDNKNDFREWLAKQLDDLREKQMFRLKPGGFLWMNLELRDALRDLHQVHPPSVGDRIRVERLIARWYGRLFVSSADPRAALAVASHALNSLACIVDEVSIPVNERVVGQVIVALRHARLVLHTAEAQLKRRVAEEQTGSSFELLRRRCLRLIGKLSSIAATRLRDLVRHEIARLGDTIARVALAVWQVERNAVGIQTLIDNSTNNFEFGQKPDSHGLRRSTSEALSQEAELQSAFVKITLRDYSGSHEKMRTLLNARVSKLIGASNSITVEGNAKPQALTTLRGSLGLPEPAVWNARQWMLSLATPAETKFVIRLFRRMAYLCMHIGQADYLSRRREQQPDARRDTKLRQICYLEEAKKWCDCGLELLRAFPENYDNFIFHQHARFRAHLGLIQARLASWEENDVRCREMFRQAKATLLDAESFVVEFPLVDDSLSRAIVLLRRAELKLLRARSWPEFRLRHKELIGHELTKQESDVVHGKGDSNLLSPKFRLVQDIWECLDRADGHLASHLKDEWWPQLSFVLRVQAIECFFVFLELNAKRVRHPIADCVPSWCKLLSEQIMSFIGKEFARFPTAFSSHDIFFIARMLEAIQHMVDLKIPDRDLLAATQRGRVLMEEAIMAPSCTGKSVRHVYPPILKYVSIVRQAAHIDDRSEE